MSNFFYVQQSRQKTCHFFWSGAPDAKMEDFARAGQRWTGPRSDKPGILREKAVYSPILDGTRRA